VGDGGTHHLGSSSNTVPEKLGGRDTRNLGSTTIGSTRETEGGGNNKCSVGTHKNLKQPAFDDIKEKVKGKKAAKKAGHTRPRIPGKQQSEPR